MCTAQEIDVGKFSESEIKYLFSKLSGQPLYAQVQPMSDPFEQKRAQKRLDDEMARRIAKYNDYKIDKLGLYFDDGKAVLSNYLDWGVAFAVCVPEGIGDGNYSLRVLGRGGRCGLANFGAMLIRFASEAEAEWFYDTVRGQFFTASVRSNGCRVDYNQIRCTPYWVSLKVNGKVIGEATGPVDELVGVNYTTFYDFRRGS